MNAEIKEILEYIKKWMGLSEIPMIVKLEDYITNLQQENERLKHQLKVQEDLTIKNRMRKHIYKSRCEKAIKYIDTNFCIENRRDLKEVVNILQNGDDKNV